MMKKKLIYLVVLLVIMLTSGCTVDYNLTISKSTDSISESIDLYFDKNSINEVSTYDNKSTIKQVIDEQLKVYTRVNYNEPSYNPYKEDPQAGIEYYTKTKINDENRYGINYNHKYDRLSSLVNSNAIANCYKNMNIAKDDGKILLNPGSIASCFENYSSLDTLNIIITVENYEVIYNTANEVQGNKYIWHLNKGNYKTNLVRLKYQVEEKKQYSNKGNIKDDITNTTSPEKNSTFSYIFIIILVILVLLVALLFVLYKIKNRKNNKI